MPQPAMVFSIADFRATARSTADVGGAIKEDWLNGVPGILYAGALHIERARDGLFCLTIANASTLSDDLAKLEEQLYAFGLSEDYFPHMA